MAAEVDHLMYVVCILPYEVLLETTGKPSSQDNVVLHALDKPWDDDLITSCMHLAARGAAKNTVKPRFKNT